MTDIIQTLMHPSGRCFVVGSLAGHFGLLGRLLDEVQFNVRQDVIVLAGNFIGFSAASRQAPGWLKKPWVHAVLGENELGVLAHLQGDQGRTLFGQWLSVIGVRERDAMCSSLFKLPVALELFDGTDQLPVVISQLRLKPGSDWTGARAMLSEAPRHTAALDAFESRMDTARALINRDKAIGVSGTRLSLSAMEVATPRKPLYRQANRAMLLGSIGTHHGHLYEADYKLAYVELTHLLNAYEDVSLCGQFLDYQGA